tara:strand:+ start:2360 stop:2506 length:147 start_codon:yes stop_codon:yes gene_type:complete
MRQKFWDYIDTPTEKKKSELTSEEQRYADRLKKAKDGKPAPTPEPKKK